MTRKSDIRMDIVTQGDDCPASVSPYRGPHVHTSVMDFGTEFYPCACGKRFDPMQPSEPLRIPRHGREP